LTTENKIYNKPNVQHIIKKNAGQTGL